ncbi:hypothetical protein DM01DRAFT_1331539 [Hesseltinella vesiculosa]|uniref:Vezatin n=1 Tax=Hesseltinella vesiculosa TaxID=101127 RepID=A0A1X2GVM7_9FUNG|nr:hypothetical protein DM01DRAFT_1331539 [Hesseltinella vesiculosa]
MGEFVVYEDTPIADYLQDIDSGEAIVKPLPLQLGIHPYPMNAKEPLTLRVYNQIYRVWRQSLIRDTFSISLPVMEESAFEEKLKYLIVTSPLLSDASSTYTKYQPTSVTLPIQPTRPRLLSTQIGTLSVISGLLIAAGIERVLPFRKQSPSSSSVLTVTPVHTLTMASGISLFFIFRHLRRSSVRRLFNHTLAQLQAFLEASQQLDNKIHRTLLTIQEIELVSRGYRLSAPLSPISRIEQSSKSRRCTKLRSHLARLLRRAFIDYEDTIINIMDHVHKPSLSRLYDMYSIHSLATLSSASLPDDHDNHQDHSDITLDYLKTLASLMHQKRRECLLQFLALSAMSDIARVPHSTQVWKAAAAALSTLCKDTNQFLHDLSTTLDEELHPPMPDTSKDTPLSSSDPSTRQFVHRLSSLDQQLRTMGARIYLCNDEFRKQNDPDRDRDQLRRDYMALERDMQQLINEWEAGRQALELMLSPPAPSTSTSSSTPSAQDTLPSPIFSPALPCDASVPTSDESLDLASLPMPSKASVFESISDILDGLPSTLPATPKKSRAQRIQEMKSKREHEAKEKASRMNSTSMVNELKNVLDRRTHDLDLE